MKVYVLLRDGVPLGYCLAAATHGTLGGILISYTKPVHRIDVPRCSNVHLGRSDNFSS